MWLGGKFVSLIAASPGGTHSVKNIGTTTLKAILVEVNHPDKAGPAIDAAMNAVKISPAHYKMCSCRFYEYPGFDGHLYSGRK